MKAVAVGLVAALMLAGCSAGIGVTTVTWGPDTVAFVPAPVDEQRFVAALNAYRADTGLAPVRRDPTLQLAAADMAERAARAEKLAIRAHSSGSLKRRLYGAGFPYSAAAENLARGDYTPEALLQVWRGSPGHDRNLRDPYVTHAGLARIDRSDDPARGYYALILARPLSDPLP